MADEKEKTEESSKNAMSSNSDENISMISETNQPANDEGFILEMERLFDPISEEHPAGESLRYEGTYDRIQEARKEDDPRLPQGVWERDLKKAEWNKVKDICIKALETRSKDLQIAVWLLEALLSLYGFAGVKEGLNLILGFCERFWDDLYPEMDENDLEGRISPFVLMNEKIALKLKFILITKPRSVDSSPYSFADYESANILENQALKDKSIFEKAESEGKATRAKFLGSVMFSPSSFYVKQSRELNDSLEILTALGLFLGEKCGRESPSLKQFKDILEAIQHLSSEFLNEKIKENVINDPLLQEGDMKESIVSDEDEKEGGKRPVFLSIRNRAEAYRMLSEAADYLLIHEPHSPAPYLVKRAVMWGHMTLTELLQELISDDSDLKQIFRLLGLRITEKQQSM